MWQKEVDKSPESVYYNLVIRGDEMNLFELAYATKPEYIAALLFLGVILW